MHFSYIYYHGPDNRLFYQLDHADFPCSTNVDLFYNTFINGVAIGSDNYSVLRNTAGVCEKLTLSSTNPVLNDFIGDRVEGEVAVITPTQEYRYKVDNIAGIRVPRVFVSILPDSLIPGEVASPHVEESTIDNGGTTEQMMLVRVRVSEAQGDVEFEVPLYGVDAEGRFAAAANGYFHAEFVPENFTTYETNCNDCVMVNGISKVKVKVPLAGLPANSEVRLDFSKVELSRDGSCSYNSADPPTDYAHLSACATVDTSHEYPLEAPPLSAFEYTLPLSAIARSGGLAYCKGDLDDPALCGNIWDILVSINREGVGKFLVSLSAGLTATTQFSDLVQDYADEIQDGTLTEAQITELKLGFEAIGNGFGEDLVWAVPSAYALKLLLELKRMVGVSKNLERLGGNGHLSNKLGQSVEVTLPDTTPQSFVDNMAVREQLLLDTMDLCGTSGYCTRKLGEVIEDFVDLDSTLTPEDAIRLLSNFQPCINNLNLNAPIAIANISYGFARSEELISTHGISGRASTRTVADWMQKLNQNGWNNLPPVLVIEVGGKKYLLDGHHRLVAAKRLGGDVANNIPYELVDPLQLGKGNLYGYSSIKDIVNSGEQLHMINLDERLLRKLLSNSQ